MWVSDPNHRLAPYTPHPAARHPPERAAATHSYPASLVSRAGSSAPGVPRLVPRSRREALGAALGASHLQWVPLGAPRTAPAGGDKVLPTPGLLHTVIAATGFALLSTCFNVSPCLRTR